MNDLVKITVTCGCGCGCDKPNVFPMGWENDVPGHKPKIIGAFDAHLVVRAFKHSEVPDVLEHLADWCRRGGKIRKIELEPTS